MKQQEIQDLKDRIRSRVSEVRDPEIELIYQVLNEDREITQEEADRIYPIEAQYHAFDIYSD